MHNVVTDQIPISTCNLVHDFAGIIQSKFFLSLNKLFKAPMGTELKNQEIVIFILDSIKTFDHIFMLKFKVNIDFLLQHFK